MIRINDRVIINADDVDNYDVGTVVSIVDGFVHCVRVKWDHGDDTYCRPCDLQVTYEERDRS